MASWYGPSQYHSTATADPEELIGYEVEHVLEQVDHVDLKAHLLSPPSHAVPLTRVGRACRLPPLHIMLRREA